MRAKYHQISLLFVNQTDTTNQIDTTIRSELITLRKTVEDRLRAIAETKETKNAAPPPAANPAHQDSTSSRSTTNPLDVSAPLPSMTTACANIVNPLVTPTLSSSSSSPTIVPSAPLLEATSENSIRPLTV